LKSRGNQASSTLLPNTYQIKMRTSTLLKIRIPILLISLATLFACHNHPQIQRVKGDLNYTQTDMQSDQLSVRLNLTANIKTQELQADLELNNPGDNPITISEIEISTPEGLRSIPKTGSMSSIILQPGENKAVSLKFQPLNDLREYQLTGRNGYFKSSYNLLITSKVNRNVPPLYTIIKANLAPSDYSAYLNKYKTTATSYSLNTKSDFTSKQSVYFSSLKKVKQPPFIFVSDQEIAVSGVNFRLSSYCEHDTLNAQIFIVNHSEFPVTINKDKLDFLYANESLSVHQKDIKVVKVSGSQQKDLIDKGDRVLIHFKKYFKNSDNMAVLSFNKAFELSDQVPLFKNNIELVKVKLP
jgi:hypothetical protein